MKLNVILKKVDRVIVWLLLALFLIFMVSGYMITKRFIDRYYGVILHTNLDIPIMMLFTIHFAINMKFILIRRGINDGIPLNLLSTIMGSSLFTFILYLDIFYAL